MTCPLCEGTRRVLRDDRAGTDMGDCPDCTCISCGETLLDGRCIYGCRIIAWRGALSAEQWTQLAVEMQRAANAASSEKLTMAFCRRRDYCAGKAKALGVDPWDRISLAADYEIAAGFSHVFEPAVLQ